MDEEFVERVFDVRLWVRGREQPRDVRFVLCEEEGRLDRRALRLEAEPPQALVLRQKRAARLARTDELSPVTLSRPAPRPRVAKPEGRQKMDRGGNGPAVRGADPDQEIVRRGLRVLDEHVEVAVFVEDAGVPDLELRVELSAPAVLLHEPGVRKLRLGAFVQCAHVRMRRRGVEVVVALLAVLAVVAFRSGQTEETFLENGIAR